MIWKSFTFVPFGDNLPQFLSPNLPTFPPGGAPRWFVRPRYEEQAWVDEVMAANDCKLRMAGLDYIVVMDLDEFIAPRKEEMTSYIDILKVSYILNIRLKLHDRKMHTQK